MTFDEISVKLVVSQYSRFCFPGSQVLIHVFRQSLLQASELYCSVLDSYSDARQTAGTAKACYVCYKPTTMVLATINTVDFLYTCPGHLSDQGFASLVSTSNVSKVDISAEEIAKVKVEWEEKEKKWKEKEKEKDKNNDSDNKAGDKKRTKEESKPLKISATPPPPAHERYTLHRDFFSSES